MSDFKSYSPETAGLIIRSLKGLAGNYDGMDLNAPHNLSNPWPRRNWFLARWDNLPYGEIRNPNLRLREMRRGILPQLERQLAALLYSLDIVDMPRGSISIHLDAQVIITHLGYTLEELNNFVRSIAPVDRNQLRNHNYCGLKDVRCHSLVEFIDSLMRNQIWTLFRHHIKFIQVRQSADKSPIGSDERCDLANQRRAVAQATALSSESIVNLIEWTRRSDFSDLEGEWQCTVKEINLTLEGLASRIESTNRLEQERVSNEKDQLATESPSTADVIRSNPSSISEHGDDQSVASLSFGLFEEPPIRPQLIQLAKSTIPFFKLFRILFNKLLKTPTGKPTFTFGTTMSSAEIKSVEREIHWFTLEIRSLSRGLFCAYDRDETNATVVLKEIESAYKSLCKDLDSCIILLCSHLVPLTSEVDLPASNNSFETWSITFKEQFCLADRNFIVALNHFKKEMQI
ncbi:hypothetical protein Pst134EA_015435 [Puccinia striiformis f. sp. tritici]|uniref:hypothetical protein n=1 Tax=Puccinia striiformis f. sp. tritici TaxID=168172 RepID=UPI0020083393|nr:hypothetical protein Pst134EA_015435 [Puccinia striiformis f. sp. tritici]KAH9463352.1 hypothetical protein Pst134EA_015435 [Puccinia striiformis f. sp. tritici]